MYPVDFDVPLPIATRTREYLRSGRGSTRLMTVRVGVVGTGMIGRDHVRRLSNVLAGAEVVAVTDVDPDNAAAAVADLPRAVVHPDGAGLVADDRTSTRSSSRPGAPPTRSTCWPASPPASRCSARSRWPPARRPAAGSSTPRSRPGRRLVQVGFMRRYDPAYRAMKDVVTSGAIGAPLLVHSRHRNPSVPSHYDARDGHHRQRGARLRHRALAARRGPRQRHRPHAPAQPARHRPAGPAAHHPAHRQRRAGGRRDVGQQQVRLRHRRRGRGGGRHRRPGRHEPGGRAPRGRVRGRGAGGLAGAVRARVRRRAAGLGGRAGRRARCDRAELLGRLRGRRRVRRRRGGPAHRRHGGVPARPATGALHRGAGR